MTKQHKAGSTFQNSDRLSIKHLYWTSIIIRLLASKHTMQHKTQSKTWGFIKLAKSNLELGCAGASLHTALARSIIIMWIAWDVPNQNPGYYQASYLPPWWFTKFGAKREVGPKALEEEEETIFLCKQRRLQASWHTLCTLRERARRSCTSIGHIRKNHLQATLLHQLSKYAHASGIYLYCA